MLPSPNVHMLILIPEYMLPSHRKIDFLTMLDYPDGSNVILKPLKRKGGWARESELEAI